MSGGTEPHAGSATIIDLLVSHARTRPDADAYIFLGAEGREAERMSFARLHGEAARIAGRLFRQTPTGSVVALAFEPGLAFVSAFLGAVMAGMLPVPLRPARGAAQIEIFRHILEVSGATVILADAINAGRLKTRPGTAGARATVHTVETGAGSVGSPASPGSWRRAKLDDIAFLQFTSGSMARPRGVAVSHGNLMSTQAAIRKAFGHGEGTTVVSWLPHFHDMGLVGAILQPLYLGVRAILMAPRSFLHRPASWLEAVSRYRATTSGAPTFGYRYCMDRIAAPAPDWDLSCWDLAFVGAEPIHGAVLEGFAKRFASAGFAGGAFYPCYGLAEATLFAAGGVKGAGFTSLGNTLGGDSLADRAGDIGCGGPVADTEIAIVDPKRRVPLADGEVGEIWLAGPQICPGYHQNPAATRRAFGQHLAASELAWLRSGDLGLMVGGQLFIRGRGENLIIVDGVNIMAEDAEAVAARGIAGIVPGGVAAWAETDPGGREILVLAAEVTRAALRDLSAQALARKIARRLVAALGLKPGRITLLRPSVLPRTSSGKVRRFAARAAVADGSLAPVFVWPARASDTSLTAAPGEWDQTAVLSWLTDCIARRLGAPARDVKLGLPFASLGLDSGDLVAIGDCILDTFGVEVTAGMFWENPTPSVLSEVLHQLIADRPMRIL